MTELELHIASNDYEMSEDRFWQIVARINWAHLSQTKKINWEAGKADIISMFDLDHRGVTELRGVEGLAWNLLDTLIGDRNPAQSGDDSHGDLISHIIGLGEDEFYACLEDYERIEARGTAPYGSPEGYRESFAYILPYETDVEDDRKTFDVTIEATVRKTVRIRHYTEEEAQQEAHTLFTATNTDEPEHYEEDCLGIKEVEASLETA
jgi:hypothetical protein